MQLVLQGVVFLLFTLNLPLGASFRSKQSLTTLLVAVQPFRAAAVQRHS